MARRFTIIQRNEILDLHLNQGYSTRVLAKEFGIGRTTIQSWLRSYRKETGADPMPNNINGKPETKVQPAKQMMLNEI